MTKVVGDTGWVGLTLILDVLPNSAWADGNLAELPRHLGNMEEHI